MGYLRFVVGTGRDSIYKLDGVFTEAGELHEAGRFTSCEAERLEQILSWFCRYLPVPPYRSLRPPERAVCWFKDHAALMIDRAWDLAWLLRSADVPVRVLHARRPGMILYEDDYQVLAQPSRY